MLNFSLVIIMNELEKVNELQKLIDESDNIVFFGGAGVSTSSGIKDFRGKNGLYNTVTDYPPEYLLSSACFYKEPELFFEFYKNNLNSLNIEPNIVHKYLKKLEDIGKLKAIVSQNIDGLHQSAGSTNVLEIHGSIYHNHCLECGKSYDASFVFNSEGIPKCSRGGTIKPDVVLYAEMLPGDTLNKACLVISNADLLIVAGTSLTVEPAASMINLFKGKNLVILNDSKTPYDNIATLVIHADLKDIFENLKA